MRNSPEFRWILKGFTPEKMPMARLADYIQQLAKMLGQEDGVHFDRVERGSVAVVAAIDRRSSGKVSARVNGIRSGTAPADAMKAYGVINAMLAQDKTTALLRDRSAVIIRFPGKIAERKALVEVPDSGSVVGYLYLLSDAGREFHARIRLESGGTLQCTVGSDIARKLREHLFETVKVYGRGVWARSEGGAWTVVSLEINEVIRAESARLRTVVDQLRKLDIEWPEDPLGYLEGINRNAGTIQ